MNASQDGFKVYPRILHTIGYRHLNEECTKKIKEYVNSEAFDKNEWVKQFLNPEIKHQYLFQFVEFANYLYQLKALEKSDLSEIVGVLVNTAEEKVSERLFAPALKDILDL